MTKNVGDASLDQHPHEPIEGIVEDNSVRHSLDSIDEMGISVFILPVFLLYVDLMVECDVATQVLS